MAVIRVRIVTQCVGFSSINFQSKGCFFSCRGQAEREFKREVTAIGRVRHKNLVRLIGYCMEGKGGQSFTIILLYLCNCLFFYDKKRFYFPLFLNPYFLCFVFCKFGNCFMRWCNGFVLNVLSVQWGFMSDICLLNVFPYSFSRLLVYEYINNGNLEQWLHGVKLGDYPPLSWDIRMKIVLGTAKAYTLLCVLSQWTLV